MITIIEDNLETGSTVLVKAKLLRLDDEIYSNQRMAYVQFQANSSVPHPYCWVHTSEIVNLAPQNYIKDLPWKVLLKAFWMKFTGK